MAKQVINLGSMADNKSGDPLRTAFTKVNQNFDELYARDAGDFDGSYNSLTDKPTIPTIPDIPTDINQLTDTDGLLGQGGGAANTGDVTFSNVQIIGKALGQIGTQIFIGADHNGNQSAVNGNGVQVPADIEGIDQVAAGWTISLATGVTMPLIAAYYWPNGNYWVLQWADNYATETAVYPLTVQTSDYQEPRNAELILKADDADWAADYGVKVFNSIDNDTHLAPLTREKGIALGFAYGQGSHIRVEGSNGQGGAPNSGDRVGIVATDGEQSSEWTFEKDGRILKEGNSILGDLQFDGNNIIPKTVYPTGTQYRFATNYINDILDIDGSTLQLPGSAPFQWIEVGMVIAFADDQTTRTVTDVRWQDGYIMVDFDSPVTLSPAYPLTVSSPNYDPGVPPKLYVVLGASQVWFDENGNINIPPNATVQDYYGNNKLTGGGSGINANVATTLGIVVYCPAQNQVFFQGDVTSALPAGQHFFFSSSQTEFIVDNSVSEYGMTLVTLTTDMGYWPQANDTAFSVAPTAVTAIQGGAGVNLSVTGSTATVSKDTSAADNGILKIAQTNGDWHEGSADPQVFNLADYNSPDLFVVSHNGSLTNLQVVLPPNPVNGKQHTIKYANRGENTQTLTVFADDKSIDAGGNSIVIDKNNGFVTVVWDGSYGTWWVIGKDII
jgi:hypothetical protein